MKASYFATADWMQLFSEACTTTHTLAFYCEIWMHLMLIHPAEIVHCYCTPSGLLLPSLFNQCTCASSDHKPQPLPLSYEHDCMTLTYYQLLLVQNITPHTF